MWQTELGSIYDLADDFIGWLDDLADKAEDGADDLPSSPGLNTGYRDRSPCVLDYVMAWIEDDPSQVLRIATRERLLLLLLVVAERWAVSELRGQRWVRFVGAGGEDRKMLSFSPWSELDRETAHYRGFDYLAQSAELKARWMSVVHPLLLPGSIEATRIQVLSAPD